MSTVEQIPFVDYLVLGDRPHLVAHECSGCQARYFDRRNACAGCFGTEFTSVEIATDGVLRAFTIVTFAAPGVDVPFVAGVVDCEGTSVRGNIVNCPPDPDHVTLGMSVRLTTWVVGADSNGVEAVNYGFEPA
ncbi:MAG: OB-fold domain-containing protein [Actinomycetota bacterium]|nr:OB-fold domain-containing protein [Ilumatobacteraceae bacterium]MDA2959144.1 OB-fold domain-containing protein [Actinomycetota bacterium]MDA3006963.1 OB-fold domain-containing protein [Actinomycetota bacterium]MDA3034959.1 OB-fold domain-containing protein [Actinomycetota bacterium]